MIRTNQINKNQESQQSVKSSNKGKKGEFKKVFKEEFATDSSKVDKTDSTMVKQNKYLTAKGNDLVYLGKISGKSPTVSNLLIKNSVYKKETWPIIHGKQNDNKMFEKIRSGEKVYMSPDTKEIIWGKDLKKFKTEVMVAQKTSQKTLSPEIKNYKQPVFKSDDNLNISKAVQSYVGKDYDEVDCFELIVKSMEDVGVKYFGNGGLREKLIGMAESKGLDRYSFLNGEGLVKASGSEVYSKTIMKVKNPETQAKKIIKEMAPHLEKDQILSFSTRSRGHTGIISQKDNSWTYINSGYMDHNVGSGNKIRGVGEETLKDEIVNWFKIANKRDEGLKISLGKLNEKKVAAFSNDSVRLNKKA